MLTFRDVGTPVLIDQGSLIVIVDRARTALDGARTAAQVLEAHDLSRFAYDTAKLAVHFAKIKGAGSSIIGAAHRLQADALEIEAGAKRRLADEYDAAQARGEVAGRSGGGERSGLERSPPAATVEDIGLSRKQVHEARQARDAEAAAPGIARRTLDSKLNAGLEPTRAALRKAFAEVIRQDIQPAAGRRDVEAVEESVPLTTCAKVLNACETIITIIGRNGASTILADIAGLKLSDARAVFTEAHAKLGEVLAG